MLVRHKPKEDHARVGFVMMMRRSVTSPDAGKRSHWERQLTEEDLTGAWNRELEERRAQSFMQSSTAIKQLEGRYGTDDCLQSQL